MAKAPEHMSSPGSKEVIGTPRWVVVFGIILILVVLMLVGLYLFGGGTHGPRRHRSFDIQPDGYGRIVTRETAKVAAGAADGYDT